MWLSATVPYPSFSRDEKDRGDRADILAPRRWRSHDTAAPDVDDAPDVADGVRLDLGTAKRRRSPLAPERVGAPAGRSPCTLDEEEWEERCNSENYGDEKICPKGCPPYIP